MFERGASVCSTKRAQRAGANLDHSERCTCGGIETAKLHTPREAIVDRMAAMEQEKARQKAIAQETLRKGIYTEICRKTNG